MIINSPLIFKPNTNSLTRHRIKLVVKYIIHCYLLMLKEERKYNFSFRGKVSHEDFLRNGLVNDYLSKKHNKEYYKNFISDNPNVEITFHPEENKTYISEGVLAEDYIDICIWENKLSELWSNKTEDEIKLSFECKRIKESKDYFEYIKDIKKFSERPFTTFKLPFEGQIAFIECSSLDHIIVCREINNRLERIDAININNLKPMQIHDAYNGSYTSDHYRSYGDRDTFSIYHLLLEYSKIIIS